MNQSSSSPKPVLLLDMNGTFMFNEDRFGAEQDYHATYRSLGGTALDAPSLHRIITEAYDVLDYFYLDYAFIDKFPELESVLDKYSEIPPDERHLIIETFARHERGTISAPYIECLHSLTQTHRLGLVANIWSPKDLWLQYFEETGIHGLFEALVFSSDGRSIKPSPKPFRQALAHMNCAAEETLFVGDDFLCDMQGAKALGMKTVWIHTEPPATDREREYVDWVIPDLLDLPQRLHTREITIA